MVEAVKRRGLFLGFVIGFMLCLAVMSVDFDSVSTNKECSYKCALDGSSLHMSGFINDSLVCICNNDSLMKVVQ